MMCFSFKKIKKYINTEISYLFFREYRFRRIVRRHLSHDYTLNAPSAKNTRKMIVYMADGKMHHGGLADRLRGIITLYQYCIEHQYDFRIYFKFPFALEDYLLPNVVDWRIRKEELSFNSKDSCALYMDVRGDSGEREVKFQRKIAEKFLSQPYKQLHVYTRFDYEEKRFGTLFNQLFKPIPLLQQEIDQIRKEIGDNYISVSARFLELLGDFKEPSGKFVQLSEEEREKLILKCIEQIRRLKEQCPGIEKIVVTADSSRFLKRVEELSYCYVIPGNIAHIETKAKDTEEEFQIHLKTFVDFFVIAHAKASYLLVGENMHHSNFSKRAAQVYGHLFEEIIF